MERYDAILIPGGGVRDGGELPEWSKRRFDMAMKYPHVQYYIPLSAGTFHKPPLLDAAGFPIYESIAGARYLMAAGVEESKILCETCSYDTIGNAYFARVIHVEPLMLKRILVITSAFHFPRTKEIFTWVFGLDHNSLGVELDFESVSDAGLDDGNYRSAQEKRKRQPGKSEGFGAKDGHAAKPTPLAVLAARGVSRGRTWGDWSKRHLRRKLLS